MGFSVSKTAWLVAGACCVLAGCASSNGPAPIETRKRVGEVQPAAPVVNKTGGTTTATSPAKAPAAEKRAANDPRPKTHTVQKGENLYRISLEYGLDYRELAAWNNLGNVHDIKVGQVLSLLAPANGVVTKPLDEGTTGTVVALPPATIASPKALKLPYSEENRLLVAQAGTLPAKDKPIEAKPVGDKTTATTKPVAPVKDASAVIKSPEKVASAPAATSEENKSAGPTSVVDGLTWMWPTSGKVIGQFNESKQLKGLDIAGKKGQPVQATEEGKVVYAGSSLRGYGKFIIVKHESDYLSVYAHNDKLLVKEGQKVTRGQKIAEMGDSEADQVKLHFEIRRYGKPVDPAKILPVR